MKRTKSILLVTLAALLLFAFNNCTNGFQTLSEVPLTSNSDLANQPGNNQDGNPIPGTTPGMSPTPPPTSTPTVKTYGTSPVPPSAACSETSFTPPALANPKDPRDFGAKCDGKTDDTAAFQKAMDAGDVYVKKGTCLLNGTVKVSVSNRHLECEPGTVFKHTVRKDSNMFQYNAGNGKLTGDSIVNCTFEGANSPVPVVDWDVPGHYDTPVQTNDAVYNFFLAGNTFRFFYGQAHFQTFSWGDGGHGDKIIFNTFESCPYYGPVFVAHADGYVAYNIVSGCTAGVENDNGVKDPNTGGQLTGGNIFECNKITNYDAGVDLIGGAITGGANGDFDYSKNIVRNNLVTGQWSFIYEKHNGKASDGAKPATYQNNTCVNGCQIDPP